MCEKVLDIPHSKPLTTNNRKMVWYNYIAGKAKVTKNDL